MNSVQKQYFQEIKRLLPCDEKQKKRCIRELKNDVGLFLEYNPSATLPDLCSAIGQPQDIAESLYNSNVSYVSKSASYSSNYATATGTVKYLSMNISRTATLYCDKNGNLS